jgi:hypothetical protein
MPAATAVDGLEKAVQVINRLAVELDIHSVRAARRAQGPCSGAGG